MEKFQVTILKPDFYDRFHCLGGLCHDNCCTEGWKIFIDKKTYKYYHNLHQPKELAVRLKKYITRYKDDPRAWGIIKYDNDGKTCPFQNEESWCELQLSLGEKYLSNTCREYPRTKNLFVDDKTAQYSLSSSCEAVLRLFLEEKEGIGFIEEKDEIMRGTVFSGGIDQGILTRRPIAAHWQTIQYAGIDILQNRQYTIEERLIILGLLCQKLQVLEDNNRIDEVNWAVKGLINALKQNNEQELLTVLPKAKLESHLLFYEKLFSNVALIITLKEKGILKTLATNIDWQTDWTFQQGKKEKSSAQWEINNQITNGENSCQRYQKGCLRYQEMMAEKEYFIENLLVMEWFRQLLPFEKETGNIWHNYQWFCGLFMIMRLILIGMLAGDESFGEKELVRVTAASMRSLGHNKNVTLPVVAFLNDAGMDTLAQLTTAINMPDLASL